MAKIGVRFPRYCPYTVTQNADGTETETYGIGKVAGKATEINTTVSAEAVQQYADDAAAEASAPFTGGTVAVGLNDLLDSVEAELCGHHIDEDGVLIANADDEAPYVLYGFIFPAILNGVKKYGVRCYKRVKFAPPGDNLQTKGEKLAFQGTTINGTLMQNKDRDWKWQKLCDKLEQAMGYLNTWLHMPSSHDALACTPVPAHEATGVAADVSITLTFNNPIDHGNAMLQSTVDASIVASSKMFNGGKTVLTITPSSALSANTKYMVVLTNMTDAYGQTMQDTIYTFTTAA